MEFISPKYLSETFERLDRSSDQIVICAGLTHLLRFYHEFPYGPHDTPEAVLHIGDVSSLSEIGESSDYYELGSTARVSDIVAHQALAQYVSAVWDAARLTSTPQIRNQRTLGGELAWGSYHSPLIAALMAVDAEVEVRKAASKDLPGREENYDLAEFYDEDLERINSRGRKLRGRRAYLSPRDLILSIGIPKAVVRRNGAFSFFKAIKPKISTENSGLVVAVSGAIVSGMLSRAQFVVSGPWIKTLKDEIPLEGTRMKPEIFFEKLFHFFDRYPLAKSRRSGPSEKQLRQMIFGLLKEGFSPFIGR